MVCARIRFALYLTIKNKIMNTKDQKNSGTSEDKVSDKKTAGKATASKSTGKSKATKKESSTKK